MIRTYNFIFSKKMHFVIPKGHFVNKMSGLTCLAGNLEKYELLLISTIEI